MFCHLNTHSKASLLYGSADVDDLVNRAKELGQSAIALTDYCNLFNAIHFYKAAHKAGVKPIIGVTVFFCDNAEQQRIQHVRKFTHLVLLAENDVGFKNIARLVSAANSDQYYYYHPRVDFDLLEKHKEGIICLTGNSLDGTISYHLFDKTAPNGDVTEPAALFRADGLVRRFLKIFDNNHFYLEVQNTGLSQQQIINSRLRELANKHNLKTVATNNVHYVNQEDAAAHKALLQMNEGKYNKSTYTDFLPDEYYLKTPDLLQEELDITHEIAERCNISIDLKKRRLPTYAFVPAGKTSAQYLVELSQQGLLKKSLSNKEYIDRLNRELCDITEMGFADYFLIVHDIISWIREQNILLGAGRGSIGGSLVAYCLGITEIDPIKYGLIWERFLNKGRGGLPDIDSDVPRSKRQDVLNYIRERFGSQNVAQLVTLSGLQAKAILKEIFRIYNMPFDEANKITALIPGKNDEHVPITLQEAIDAVPKLKEYYDKYPSWFKIALNLEGSYKSTGIHPGAVIISDVPFDDSYYPLARSKDGGQLVAWDMNTVDDLSILKLDLLGLTTLDDIHDSFNLINERHKSNISRDTIPLDDPKTYALLERGYTVGVFQIEKQLGKTWTKALKPTNIFELSDVISLIRPATLETGLTKQYKETKDGTRPFEPAHQLLNEIVKDTYGVLAYQEQTIFACQKLAGFSLVESDSIRRVIGKKKPEELKTWKPKFVDGCINNGVNEESANEVWNQLEKFAGYQFNRSHGIGYALLAYETAYLKANYPLEFYCIKLRHADSHPDKMEQMSALIYDAKLFDIEVVPPRLSHGNKDFAIIDDKTIAFGLSSIKGVGKGTVNELIRASKSCKTFDEILWKSKINSGAMLALIRCGAFDDLISHRVECQRRFKLFTELTDREKEIIVSVNASDWVETTRLLSSDDYVSATHKVPNKRRRETLRGLLNDYDRSEIFDSKPQRIAWEQFYLGISLSGSEADIYKSKDKCIDLVKNGEAGIFFEISVCVDAVREIITTKGEPMAFLTARDHTHIMNNIVVFPRTFSSSRTLLEAGNVLKIKGKMDDRGSLIANRIERLL